jgi:hypothetical protein
MNGLTKISLACDSHTHILTYSHTHILTYGNNTLAFRNGCGKYSERVSISINNVQGSTMNDLAAASVTERSVTVCTKRYIFLFDSIYSLG